MTLQTDLTYWLLLVAVIITLVSSALMVGFIIESIDAALSKREPWGWNVIGACVYTLLTTLCVLFVTDLCNNI